MDLVEILNAVNSEKIGRVLILDSIRFEKNDYFVSIQASPAHYCSPRKFLRFEEYTHFEVMTDIPPDDIPSGWDKYRNGDDPYGWVPKAEVEELLARLDKKYKILY